MSNDKTLGDAVRYEWFSASEQWSACDHSEAKKLSAAGYEVREVRGFRMDCTCPSGDGSLRHPCPAHPATLATAKHGGCVQLSTSERERFEAWAISRGWSIQRCEDGLRRYRSCDTEKMWEAFQAALSALSAQPQYITDAYELGMRDGQALSAQPSPGGQGDAWATLSREWAIDGMPADKQRLARAAFVAGAAGAVNGQVMVNMGDSEAEYIRANDEEAALAVRQPVGEQVGVTQFRHPGCTDWYDVTEGNRHVLTDPDFEKRTLYPAPPAQAADMGAVRKCLRECIEFVNHGYGGHARRKVEEALALIDGQAVGK